MPKFDVLIIGAGAAGLMCAIEAGKRGRKVLILDHANKVGRKILMSGGGHCNFTNYHVNPAAYLSHNPHFCKSALSRYTQWDFIALVEKYQIPFHEKTLGQLFCDNKAKAIVDLLLAECAKYGVEISLNSSVDGVSQTSAGAYEITTAALKFSAEALVIACGGLSIPSMGSSPLGYRIAEQFGLKVWPTRAGLVPLTLHEAEKEQYSKLAGIAVASIVSNKQISFRENILFTHRGLSGPAILQISSYWQPGESLQINLLPDLDLFTELKSRRRTQASKQLKSLLVEKLPKRLVEVFIPEQISELKIAEISDDELAKLARQINHWEIKPNGTEGYRTAEVTLGGVDCNELSSQTMEAKKQAGLYFIGEVVDVTGWLGGFNFQWAWSSGWAAGQVV